MDSLCGFLVSSYCEFASFGKFSMNDYNLTMIEPNQILEQALTLPENQRAAIAASLLNSLDSESDSDSEAEWELEIKRRLDEIDNGTVELIPWSEVQRKVQKIRDEL